VGIGELHDSLVAQFAGGAFHASSKRLSFVASDGLTQEIFEFTQLMAQFHGFSLRHFDDWCSHLSMLRLLQADAESQIEERKG
jgi:hypothetical protein